jgi:uncharacterized protein (TIGR02099 family)
MLWLAVAVLSLTMLAWLTLHWGILPHIAQWRAPIEARASKALGVPVRIGDITVRSDGWALSLAPSFELRNVVLLDAQQRPALTLPRVAASISPGSLLGGRLNFSTLLIEGAVLEVQRDAQGRIRIAGLPLAERDGEGAAADWFFRQHDVAIRGGTLRWTDALHNAPPLTFSDVQFTARNRLLGHELSLAATPDAAWGERFTLGGNFRQALWARAGDWRRWSGSTKIELPRTDLRELRRHVDLPFELSEGDGAVRADIEVKDGEAQRATVDLALRAVTLRLSPTVQPLRVAQVAGRLVGERHADGLALAATGLRFVTGDGIRWPAADLSVRLRQRAGEPATGGEFSARRLDLAVMAQVAARVPMSLALRRHLAELKPRGSVSELKARWDGPLDAPTHYQADASVSGLALAARASAEPEGVGRPGLRNAAVTLSASEIGGQAQLSITQGELEFPGVFAEAAVPIDQLSAKLQWTVDAVQPAGTGPRLSVAVKDASFSNPDAQGEFTATWRTGAPNGPGRPGGRYPGVLELDGTLKRGLAARTARYLPLAIPAQARHYVADAVRGGRVPAASFHVKGELRDFPFLEPASRGEFRITAEAEDVNLDYVPSTPARGAEPAFVSHWPAFGGVGGELVFDRASMTIRNAHGQLGAVRLSQVQGRIANFANTPTLAIEGGAAGPLGDMLNFVNTTPVGGWIGDVLAHAQLSGPADLKLALNLPLDALDTSKVKGSVVLAGNDVRITPDTPLLAAAKGRVDFSEDGFAVPAATAQVAGGELAFEGGMKPGGEVRFNGQGTASAEGLRRATELGPLARVATVLTGQTAYRIGLGFLHGQSEIHVTSNLVGMAADVPAPLRKTADTALPMRYQTSLTLDPGAKADAVANRDTLRFELGSLVQAQFQRDLSGATPRVLRGGIGVNELAPTPANGVAAHATLASLNTEAWSAVATRLGAAEAGAEGLATAPPGGYLPNTAALSVQELVAGPRRLSRLTAGLSLDDGLWRANLDADQLSGYVEYRPARRGDSAAAAGRVHARLARLSIPKGDVEQVETLLDQQTASVPALDIVVDDFELRGKHLGRVEIEALNSQGGEARDGPREWRLSKFNISNPQAQFTATGHWIAATAPATRRRAVLDFKLALADSGALLDRLGNPKAIRGGKGVMVGQVAWLGSPLTPDIPSLSGQVNVVIDSGQFLKVDPGAARLLGVLSLQSLPRRLVLDFRDLFQEGFPFDNITGDVTIAQGVAQTNNFRMRGVQAAVLMDGRADIARETQDLRVIVVPEVNAGTASLAYAVINPVVGLGTFLAQLFLSKPLAEAGTREFRITGPWADPKVDRVERKPEHEAPASEANR